MTFGNVRCDPFQLDQAEAKFLVRPLFTSILKCAFSQIIPLVIVAPKAMGYCTVRVSKRLNKGVLIQRKGRKLTHCFEELALYLPILHPDFLQIDPVTPLTFTSLACCEGIVTERGSIGLRNDCEHLIAEVALPLIYVRVVSYLLR